MLYLITVLQTSDDISQSNCYNIFSVWAFPVVSRDILEMQSKHWNPGLWFHFSKLGYT